MNYCLYTLIDITETKQHHGGDIQARHQQQNFDSVLQTIGLVGNISSYQSPVQEPAVMFNQKNKTAWKFEWTMEHPQVFVVGNDPVGKLTEVFEFVPIIEGLTENAKLEKPMFQVGKNIMFTFK